MPRRFLSVFLILCLLQSSQPVAASEVVVLPAAGTMVHVSPSFAPAILKGIKVDPANPLKFEFILEQGDVVSGPASSARGAEPLRTEANKLIKYFLASLTVPEKDLWVNLSPYEKDRIVPESFGQTQMGRDLLAQDYLLKQLTASMVYPDDELGKKFWKRVYEEAVKDSGNTEVRVNAFNKVWIVPDKAVVYENAKAGTAYVVESSLKVLTEQDYLAQDKNAAGGAQAVRFARSLRGTMALSPATPRGDGLSEDERNSWATGPAHAIRDLVIPQLTKEVNEGKNFAVLRQVYNSLILALWYKKKIKDSLLARAYADRNKTDGVGYGDDLNAQVIYQRYLEAFKKGAYNLIKEEIDPLTRQMVPRKYFSGGMTFMGASQAMVATDKEPKSTGVEFLVKADLAMAGKQLIKGEGGFDEDPQFRRKLNNFWQGRMRALNVTQYIGRRGMLKGEFGVNFRFNKEGFKPQGAIGVGRGKDGDELQMRYKTDSNDVIVFELIRDGLVVSYAEWIMSDEKDQDTGFNIWYMKPKGRKPRIFSEYEKYTQGSAEGLIKFWSKRVNSVDITVVLGSGVAGGFLNQDFTFELFGYKPGMISSGLGYGQVGDQVIMRRDDGNEDEIVLERIRDGVIVRRSRWVKNKNIPLGAGYFAWIREENLQERLFRIYGERSAVPALAYRILRGQALEGPALVGKTFPQTSIDGNSRFMLFNDFPVDVWLGVKKPGYQPMVIWEGENAAGFYEFRIRATKPGENTLIRSYEIGRLKAKRISREGALYKVFPIVPVDVTIRNMLKNALRLEGVFNPRQIEKELKVFSNVVFTQTNDSGGIRITIADGVRIRLPFVGTSMGKDWDVSLAGVKANTDNTRLRLIFMASHKRMPGEYIIKVYEIGGATSDIEGQKISYYKPIPVSFSSLSEAKEGIYPLLWQLKSPLTPNPFMNRVIRFVDVAGPDKQDIIENGDYQLVLDKYAVVGKTAHEKALYYQLQKIRFSDAVKKYLNSAVFLSLPVNRRMHSLLKFIREKGLVLESHDVWRIYKTFMSLEENMRDEQDSVDLTGVRMTESTLNRLVDLLDTNPVGLENVMRTIITDGKDQRLIRLKDYFTAQYGDIKWVSLEDLYDLLPDRFKKEFYRPDFAMAASVVLEDLSADELNLLREKDEGGGFISKRSRDDDRIRRQVIAIETARGMTEDKAKAQAEAVILALNHGEVNFKGEEVHVLSGVALSDKVIGRIDRNIAEHFGYAHESANVVLVAPSGKVILQVRNKDKSDNYLAMYGGHLEVGQPHQKAAEQETMQEAHLDALDSAPIFVGYESFDVPGIGNKERRLWFVKFVNQHEYDRMKANKDQEDIRAGIDRNTVSREAHKNALFALSKKEGSGTGEVLALHEFTINEIEHAPVSNNPRSPFKNKRNHFLTVQETYQGVVVPQELFFSPGSMNRLLRHDNKPLWEAIKHAVATGPQDAAMFTADLTKRSDTNMASEDGEFSVDQADHAQAAADSFTDANLKLGQILVNPEEFDVRVQELMALKNRDLGGWSKSNTKFIKVSENFYYKWPIWGRSDYVQGATAFIRKAYVESGVLNLVVGYKVPEGILTESELPKDRLFQISRHFTTGIRHNKLQEQHIDALVISDRLAGVALSRMMDVDQFKALRKARISLKGIKIQEVNRSSAFSFRPFEGYPVVLPVLGFKDAQGGWEAVFIDDHFDKQTGYYEFTLKATKQGKDPVFRTFEIGRLREKVIVEGVEKEIFLIVPKEEVAYLAIKDALLNVSDDFVPQSIAQQLNSLKGREIVKSNRTPGSDNVSKTGEMDFLVSGRVRYVWSLLGFADEGWTATILGAVVNEQGIPEISVGLSKKDEPFRIRTFELSKDVFHKDGASFRRFRPRTYQHANDVLEMAVNNLGKDWLAVNADKNGTINIVFSDNQYRSDKYLFVFKGFIPQKPYRVYLNRSGEEGVYLVAIVGELGRVEYRVVPDTGAEDGVRIFKVFDKEIASKHQSVFMFTDQNQEVIVDGKGEVHLMFKEYPKAEQNYRVVITGLASNKKYRMYLAEKRNFKQSVYFLDDQYNIYIVEFSVLNLRLSKNLAVNAVFIEQDTDVDEEEDVETRLKRMAKLRVQKLKEDFKVFIQELVAKNKAAYPSSSIIPALSQLLFVTGNLKSNVRKIGSLRGMVLPVSDSTGGSFMTPFPSYNLRIPVIGKRESGWSPKVISDGFNQFGFYEFKVSSSRDGEGAIERSFEVGRFKTTFYWKGVMRHAFEIVPVEEIPMLTLKEVIFKQSANFDPDRVNRAFKSIAGQEINKVITDGRLFINLAPRESALLSVVGEKTLGWRLRILGSRVADQGDHVRVTFLMSRVNGEYRIRTFEIGKETAKTQHGLEYYKLVPVKFVTFNDAMDETHDYIRGLGSPLPRGFMGNVTISFPDVASPSDQVKVYMNGEYDMNFGKSFVRKSGGAARSTADELDEILRDENVSEYLDSRAFTLLPVNRKLGEFVRFIREQKGFVLSTHDLGVIYRALPAELGPDIYKEDLMGFNVSEADYDRLLQIYAGEDFKAFARGMVKDRKDALRLPFSGVVEYLTEKDRHLGTLSVRSLYDIMPEEHKRFFAPVDAAMTASGKPHVIVAVSNVILRQRVVSFVESQGAVASVIEPPSDLVGEREINAAIARDAGELLLHRNTHLIITDMPQDLYINGKNMPQFSPAKILEGVSAKFPLYRGHGRDIVGISYGTDSLKPNIEALITSKISFHQRMILQRKLIHDVEAAIEGAPAIIKKKTTEAGIDQTKQSNVVPLKQVKAKGDVKSMVIESPAGSKASADIKYMPNKMLVRGMRVLLIGPSTSKQKSFRDILQKNGALVTTVPNWSGIVEAVYRDGLPGVIVDLTKNDGRLGTLKTKILKQVWPQEIPDVLSGYEMDLDGLLNSIGQNVVNGSDPVIKDANKAMTATGGIDLSAASMNAKTRQDGPGQIQFHFDPAQMAQLQNASGLLPVIVSILPLTDLHGFLSAP